MSEKLKESLSAVIDGEADEFELRRVLDEIGKDDLLAASWERYHVIGSVMRSERGQVSVGMRERIWAELQTDLQTEQGERTSVSVDLSVAEGHLPASKASSRRWAPFAVAASVAVAVVIGFIGYGELEVDSPTLVAESAINAGQTINAQQEALYQTVALKAEVTDSDQTRTDAYIVRHYQQIGMDRPGIGFARMVAYERD